MPRRAKGARLYLKTTPNGSQVWIIRDGLIERGTGYTADDRDGAETALANYIAAKRNGGSVGEIVDWLRLMALGKSMAYSMESFHRAADLIEQQQKEIEMLTQTLREIEEDMSEAVVHLDELRSATGMAALRDALAIARAALKEGE